MDLKNKLFNKFKTKTKVSFVVSKSFEEKLFVFNIRNIKLNFFISSKPPTKKVFHFIATRKIILFLGMESPKNCLLLPLFEFGSIFLTNSPLRNGNHIEIVYDLR